MQLTVILKCKLDGETGHRKARVVQNATKPYEIPEKFKPS